MTRQHDTKRCQTAGKKVLFLGQDTRRLKSPPGNGLGCVACTVYAALLPSIKENKTLNIQERRADILVYIHLSDLKAENAERTSILTHTSIGEQVKKKKSLYAATCH